MYSVLFHLNTEENAIASDDVNHSNYNIDPGISTHFQCCFVTLSA